MGCWVVGSPFPRVIKYSFILMSVRRDELHDIFQACFHFLTTVRHEKGLNGL